MFAMKDIIEVACWVGLILLSLAAAVGYSLWEEAYKNRRRRR